MISDLQKQIDELSKEVRTDQYSLSIGELISIYKDGEIEIHPEFQRFYRWTPFQKSRLIESILLHIPIPPIYVAQREDGIWDVIDGLQRLSTILEFVGVLKDSDGGTLPPLTLTETQLLTTLNGVKFLGESDEHQVCFDDTLRRYFKREKLNLVIIQKESDQSSKYELFQRLNTGGSALTEQEVRSCLIVMNNPTAYSFIQRMSENDNFINSTRLSDNNKSEQYDLELIVRHIILKNIDLDGLNQIKDLSLFLNDTIIDIAKDPDFDWIKELREFEETYRLLANIDMPFTRYDVTKGRFLGGFLVSAFEIVSLGIGYAVSLGQSPEDVEAKIKNAWEQIQREDITWTGRNTSDRLRKTIPLGRRIFTNEN